MLTNTIPPARNTHSNWPPVRVVSVCDLNLPENFQESIAALNVWLRANDATYYAAPKEDCHEHCAIAKARREGKSCVVMEDLS